MVQLYLPWLQIDLECIVSVAQSLTEYTVANADRVGSGYFDACDFLAPVYAEAEKTYVDLRHFPCRRGGP